MINRKMESFVHHITALFFKKMRGLYPAPQNFPFPHFYPKIFIFIKTDHLLVSFLSIKKPISVFITDRFKTVGKRSHSSLLAIFALNIDIVYICNL